MLFDRKSVDDFFSLLCFLKKKNDVDVSDIFNYESDVLYQTFSRIFFSNSKNLTMLLIYLEYQKSLQTLNFTKQSDVEH